MDDIQAMGQEYIDLEKVFAQADIESLYLQNLLKRVLFIISRFVNIYGIFGPIHEGRIFGSPAAVTWEGEIYLDSKRLQQYDDQIAMAIIAHELAHYHMGHYVDRKRSPEKEMEANELVKSWGFDIENFEKEFPINGEKT